MMVAECCSKKLLFLGIGLLPLTVQSDNTFNFYNQSKDSAVTVVVFSKSDAALASYKEIARGNVKPTDRLSLVLPQDQIKIKYDVYFPAISPVTREGSSAEGGSIVRGQRTSVTGVIDVTHEKPILVHKVKFEKNTSNQVLSMGVNEKSLGITAESSVVVPAPAKPLTSEETKTARACSVGAGAASAGAGQRGTSGSPVVAARTVSARPMMKSSGKSASKIPRWTTLGTNPSQAKKEADRKRAAERKAAQEAAAAQQSAPKEQ